MSLNSILQVPSEARCTLCSSKPPSSVACALKDCLHAKEVLVLVCGHNGTVVLLMVILLAADKLSITDYDDMQMQWFVVGCLGKVGAMFGGEELES